MEFDITVRQTLEGHVTMEGKTLSDALDKAYVKYGQNGHELPDMDDTEPLMFFAEKPSKEYTAPSRDEVEAYLRRHGRPDLVINSIIDEFICFDDENRRSQYWEAVANDYYFGDFDRWQHFENVIGTECSWNCFLVCDRAFYAEDIEMLELGHFAQQTPVQAQKTSAKGIDEIISNAESRKTSQPFYNTKEHISER